jgi:hypothetical protein
MIKSRMRLTRIRPLYQLSQSFLSLLRDSRNSLLKRLVETNRVRQRTRVTPCITHVAEIVDSHSRDNDKDVVIAEGGDGLAKAVMLIWIFGVEERDLDDWDVQRIFFWFEGCYVSKLVF